MRLKIMRKWRSLVVTGLLGFAAVAVGFYVIKSRPPPALVTFIVDDTSNTQYRYAFNLARKYDIPATLFVPTEMVDMSERGEGYEWIMGWDKLREISAAGWDLGSHSRTHSHLGEQSYDEVTAELAGSQLEIEREIGIKPVSFSSPFGNFNDEIIARIMDYYDYHVSWKGHLGRNHVMKLDPRYIGRLEVTNDMSVEQVCGEMVRPAEPNIWLVLLFHGIVEEDAGDYQVTVDMLDQIFACAKELDDNGIIRIETVRDAGEIANRRKNALVAQWMRRLFHSDHQQP